MQPMRSVFVHKKKIVRELHHNNTLMLTVTVECPVFEAGRFAVGVREINRFYAQEVSRFIARCLKVLLPMAMGQYAQSQKDGYPFFAYEAMLTHTITYNQGCALSLYANRYEYTGGAHGNTLRTSQTWNVPRARPMPLAEFFPGTDNLYAALQKGIIERIARRVAAGENGYFDDYPTLVRETFNPQSFYLSPQGVVVYFQQYDIAPYSTGIPEFTFAWAGEAEPPRCG